MEYVSTQNWNTGVLGYGIRQYWKLEYVSTWVRVRYFRKGIFPRATSKVTIFQVATSKMCNFPSGNFPKVRLSILRRRRLQWELSAAAKMDWRAECRGQNRMGGRALRLGQTWEVTAWENILWKLPLGENLLGKYLTYLVMEKGSTLSWNTGVLGARIQECLKLEYMSTEVLGPGIQECLDLE